MLLSFACGEGCPGNHVWLCVSRWDGCFIRLLDGMLQAGALTATATTTDFELKIPTKICHLAVKVPGPELPIGSEGAHRPSQHMSFGIELRPSLLLPR